MLQPEIGTFRLHLAAEGRAGKTVQTYTDTYASNQYRALQGRTSQAS
jgi:hypothetical protein